VAFYCGWHEHILIEAQSWGGGGEVGPFGTQAGGTVPVMRVAYNKLVRDRIPDIIAAAGSEPVASASLLVPGPGA
jgi:hypothetical protein